MFQRFWGWRWNRKHPPRCLECGRKMKFVENLMCDKCRKELKFRVLPDGGVVAVREIPTKSETKYLTREEAEAEGIYDEGEPFFTPEELEANAKKIDEEFEKQLKKEEEELIRRGKITA